MQEGCHKLIFVEKRFCNRLTSEGRELVVLLFLVVLVAYGFYRYLPLPYGAVSWSDVCDYEIYWSHLVLQISRLSEGSTGQIIATSSVIYQMKMWGL